jgi:hypothetical protein
MPKAWHATQPDTYYTKPSIDIHRISINFPALFFSTQNSNLFFVLTFFPLQRSDMVVWLSVAKEESKEKSLFLHEQWGNPQENKIDIPQGVHYHKM